MLRNELMDPFVVVVVDDSVVAVQQTTQNLWLFITHRGGGRILVFLSHLRPQKNS